MLLLLVFRYNTEWINSAYAAYHGRFGKTNGELPSINCDFYDLDCLERGNISYVLPAHSEIVRLFERKTKGSSVELLQHYNLGVHIGVHIGDYKPCFLVLFNITW